MIAFMHASNKGRPITFSQHPTVRDLSLETLVGPGVAFVGGRLPAGRALIKNTAVCLWGATAVGRRLLRLQLDLLEFRRNRERIRARTVG
jgi:hypothetical protein